MYTLPQREGQVLEKLNWQSYSFGLYDSVEPIAKWWDNYVGDKDIFMSSPYLSALEAASPARMSYYYIFVEDEVGVQGVIYFQLLHFNAGTSLNYNRNGKSSGTSIIRKAVRDFLAQRIEFYALVCGNSAITGPHGFLFNEHIDQETQLNILDCCLDWIQSVAVTRGINVQLIFIKDFYNPIFMHSDGSTNFPQFNECQAQPGMIMLLQESWHSFGDYMSDLQSRYRIRVRRARKKCEHIERRLLGIEDIIALESQMYKYYRAIADKAVFNLSILHEKYFSVLKDRLKDKFHVYGYFENGKLIAFYSMIDNNNCLEAHFLGYEDSVNRDKQLYLNMLLDIIAFCITAKCGKILFARTALEIKSSVGAEAHNMYFYLRHLNGLHNKILPLIYNVLDPREDWEARSPFKVVDAGNK